jgi:chemotaxis protein histidine kinase CheA
MDRYDAIREQLKGAQSRGLDTSREHLNQVLEAIEQLKSAVREALDRPADEVFPIADIEAAIAVLEEEPPVERPSGFSLDAIRRLDAARTQSDLLHELMTILSEHATRTVVLVLRDNAVSAWSGVGFLDASALEKWQGAVGDSPLLRSFADDPRPLRFSPADDPVVSEWLADIPPAVDAILVPVSLRGKLMGAFYADSIADDPWDPDMIQSVVAVGCWLIDTLHHRTEVPSPMLGELVDASDLAADVAPVAAEEEEPEVEMIEGVEETAGAEPEFEAVEEIAGEEPEFEEAEEIAAEEPGFEEVKEDVAEEPGFEQIEEDFAEEPQVEVAADAVAEEPEFAPEETAADDQVEFEVAEVEDEPDLVEDPTFDPSATVQVDLDEIAEQEESGPPVAEAEVAAVAESPAAVEPPAVEAVEPPPVQPVVPPDEVAVEEADEDAAQLTPDEETRHEEARRFARLLVSEIKLYNEEEVDQGRASRNLYQRLKEDIDRSREMYEKRISPDIRAAKDYFHEELVRILADGDAGALGM